MLGCFDFQCIIEIYRSNFLGTAYLIYDNGVSPRKKIAHLNESLRKEYAYVTYAPNFMGYKGPRKMTVALPTVDCQGKRNEVQPMEVTY